MAGRGKQGYSLFTDDFESGLDNWDNFNDLASEQTDQYVSPVTSVGNTNQSFFMTPKTTVLTPVKDGYIICWWRGNNLIGAAPRIQPRVTCRCNTSQQTQGYLMTFDLAYGWLYRGDPEDPITLGNAWWKWNGTTFQISDDTWYKTRFLWWEDTISGTAMTCFALDIWNTDTSAWEAAEWRVTAGEEGVVDPTDGTIMGDPNRFRVDDDDKWLSGINGIRNQSQSGQKVWFDDVDIGVAYGGPSGGIEATPGEIWAKVTSTEFHYGDGESWERYFEGFFTGETGTAGEINQESEGTVFIYGDAYGDMREVNMQDTGESGTPGDTSVEVDGKRFRHVDAGGKIREVEGMLA